MVLEPALDNSQPHTPDPHARATHSAAPAAPTSGRRRRSRTRTRRVRGSEVDSRSAAETAAETAGGYASSAQEPDSPAGSHRPAQTVTGVATPASPKKTRQQTGKQTNKQADGESGQQRAKAAKGSKKAGKTQKASKAQQAVRSKERGQEPTPRRQRVPVTIRAFHPGDTAAVLRLVVAVHEETGWPAALGVTSPGSERAAAAARWFTHAGTVHAMVAVDAAAEVVGFVRARCAGAADPGLPHWEEGAEVTGSGLCVIGSLCVSADVAGAGVSQQLLEEMVAWACAVNRVPVAEAPLHHSHLTRLLAGTGFTRVGQSLNLSPDCIGLWVHHYRPPLPTVDAA